MSEISKAAQDVLEERRRQIEVEEWTPDYDDCHEAGTLACAGAAYALQAGMFPQNWNSASYRAEMPHVSAEYGDIWPFSLDWWKPKDRRRDLVKAAALILAEIERLDRAEAHASAVGGTGADGGRHG